MTTQAPSLADPLGFDLAYAIGDDGLDLDPTGRAATGLELVDYAIIARLSEDTLSLIDSPHDEVEFGENVRAWVGEALDDAALAAKGPRLSLILQRDQRIARADVQVRRASPGTTFDDGSAVTIEIEIAVTTTTGATLDRIVGVSQITVEFLAAGT